MCSLCCVVPAGCVVSCNGASCPIGMSGVVFDKWYVGRMMVRCGCVAAFPLCLISITFCTICHKPQQALPQVFPGPLSAGSATDHWFATDPFAAPAFCPEWSWHRRLPEQSYCMPKSDCIAAARRFAWAYCMEGQPDGVAVGSIEMQFWSCSVLEDAKFPYKAARCQFSNIRQHDR